MGENAVRVQRVLNQHGTRECSVSRNLFLRFSFIFPCLSVCLSIYQGWQIYRDTNLLVFLSKREREEESEKKWRPTRRIEGETTSKRRKTRVIATNREERPTSLCRSCTPSLPSVTSDTHEKQKIRMIENKEQQLYFGFNEEDHSFRKASDIFALERERDD